MINLLIADEFALNRKIFRRFFTSEDMIALIAEAGNAEELVEYSLPLCEGFGLGKGV